MVSFQDRDQRHPFVKKTLIDLVDRLGDSASHETGLQSQRDQRGDQRGRQVGRSDKGQRDTGGSQWIPVPTIYIYIYLEPE